MALGVAGQLFMRSAELIRSDDLNQLDLVELMLADHAAHVAATGTGFGTEARGMADQLERQRLGRGNFVAHDVGHRHFGSRDQVERIGLASQYLEQVFLELGQLAGAEQAGGVDQIRGINLGVAMLCRVRIEHELGRAHDAGGPPHLAAAKKRAPVNLGGRVEIDAVQAVTDIGVILDLEIEGAELPPSASFRTLSVSSAPTGTESPGMFGRVPR